MYKLLNLGCGRRIAPTWINVDFVSHDRAVIAHDLRKGLPFPPSSFEVIYCSHLVEHFTIIQARAFLRECYRCLEQNGTVRIVVPDLEGIVRAYLHALDRGVAQGDEHWRYNYEWMKLELLDQMVRESPGGQMATYLRRASLPNADFITSRVGREAEGIIAEAASVRRSKAGRSRWHLVLVWLVRAVPILVRNAMAPREILLRVLVGAEYPLLQLGRFRRSGEIHLWMYDRYSLAHLLTSTGFQNPRVVGPTESRINDWSSHHLDTEPDGTIYKPDSLYMEAYKL